MLVTNTTPNEDGSDAEDDDHLCSCIHLAPTSFSTTGSREAYRFHAMSVHPEICDVVVTRLKTGYGQSLPPADQRATG